MGDFFIIQYADTSKETGLIATCQSEYYAKLIQELMTSWKDNKGYDSYTYNIETSLENMYEHRLKLENNRKIREQYELRKIS